MSAALYAAFREASDLPPGPEELDWYKGHVPPGAGPVLYAACGTGTVLLALLAGSCNVHGAEADPALFPACERRLRAAGFTAPLFRQDVATLNVPFRYGTAFVGASAWQHARHPREIDAGLTRLKAHLVEPAIVLVQFVVPREAAHPPGAPIVEIDRVRLADASSITLRCEIRVDTASRKLERAERYERRASGLLVAREDRTVVATWFDEDEALGLVAQAGFVEGHVEHPPRPDPDGSHRFAVIASA